MTRRSEGWLLGVLALLSACGAWQPEVSSPMSRRDLLLFDGGRDPVTDPAVLPDAFAARYAERLEGLVARSDLIAVVVVERWRADTGPDGVPRRALHARIERVIDGDSGETVSLARREDEPGYAALEEGAGALEGARAVAFIKWSEAYEGAAVEASFHLSPASDPVLAAVDEALEARD